MSVNGFRCGEGVTTTEGRSVECDEGRKLGLGDNDIDLASEGAND